MRTSRFSCKSIRLWALLLSCFAGSILSGQNPTAAILGTVRDPSGAVVVGGDVTAKNEQTQTTRKTKTNERGDYEFDLLPLGKYTITAQSAGFRTWMAQGLKLDIDQRARVDIDLQVGQANETVAVEAATPLVEADHSSIGEVVGGKHVVDLPLNNRQFLGLVSLGPGTTPAPGDFRSAEPGGRGAILPSASGGRPEDNNYQIDGIDNREIGRANYGISPSIEGIAEFKVNTGIMSAEHGRVASASIEVVTRAGSNEFHGSLFEFLRNNATTARNFFERNVSALKRNQFGGSLGGPIVKNKHFFFGAYERFAERSAGAPVVGIVPTPQMLQGIFQTSIRDALNGGQPFANNTIPANRIDPLSRKVVEFLPQPNNADPARNFVYTRDSTRQDKNLITLRSDHELGNKDHLYGRYLLDDENLIEAPQVPSGAGGRISSVHAQGFAVNETHTFSPAIINQVSFGWNRFDLKINDAFAYKRDVAKELGLELVGLGDDPRGWAFPNVTIQGFFGLSGFFPRPRRTDVWQAGERLSIVRGNHLMRTGADARRYYSYLFSPGGLNGDFSFQGSFTGNPVADLLLGWPLSWGRAIEPAEQNGALWYFAGFISDDWKVTPKLTLNLGVRYEVETALTERDSNIARFDLKSGHILFPEATRSRVEPFYSRVITDTPFGFYTGGLYNSDRNNIAPRFGFAYRPFRGNRTVIRGGFGIFYNAPQVATLLGSVSVPPFTKRPQPTSDRNVPELRWNPIGGYEQAIKGPFTCFCMVSPDQPYSYMEQWAFTLQQSLSRDFMVELGYIGSHTLKLVGLHERNLAPPGPGSLNTRAPYPQWARIESQEQDFSSKYQALTVKAEKRIGTGLSFLLAYTFAKTLDQVSTLNAVSISRPENYAGLENGLADFNVRHRFSGTYNYDLPFGPGRHVLGQVTGWKARLVEGWGVRGITTFAAGFPVNVTMAADRLNSGAGVVPRPNRIANGNLPTSERNLNRWFDTSAFVLPPLYTPGNAGRNVIIGPGLNNFDVAVIKSTAVRERHRLEFRAEFFNAFNHTNFALPSGNISAPASFAKISGAAPARIIQFGLKWYF